MAIPPRQPTIMPLRRNILILGIVGVLIAGLVFVVPSLTPQYFSFRHRNGRYYADFTAACDSLLAEHPVGTNRFIELAVTDASIPKIVRDLRPVKIKLATNWVWILYGGGVEFSVTWEQDETQTNAWVLSTTCESHTRTVYVK